MIYPIRQPLFRGYCNGIHANIRLTLSRLKQHLQEDFQPGSKTALVLVTHGCKEGDIVLPTSIFRRAGIVVTIAGLAGYTPVRCARKMVIKPDTSLESAIEKKFDIILIPAGSEAVRSFGTSDKVGLLLKRQEIKRGIISAVGLGTLVLTVHGIYLNRNITGHPLTKHYLENFYKYTGSNIVTDEPLLTCKSTVHALDMSLTMVEIVCGKYTALSLAERMFLSYQPHTLTRDEIEQWKFRSIHFNEV